MTGGVRDTAIRIKLEESVNPAGEKSSCASRGVRAVIKPMTTVMVSRSLEKYVDNQAEERHAVDQKD